MKVDLKKVVEIFVDSVIEQADMKEVPAEELSLILFPMEIRKSFRTRCKIFSMTGSFETEIVKLKKITMIDQVGSPISKAVMELFKSEIETHNGHVDLGTQIPSVVNQKGAKIGLEGLECYIQVINKSGTYELKMNMIHNKTLLRPYDISKEFGEMDGDDIPV